jgi:hypothetical protein
MDGHRLRGHPEKMRPGKKGGSGVAETSPVWFPLHMFFRQQALMSSTFATMLRLQRQATETWLSPAQRG